MKSRHLVESLAKGARVRDLYASLDELKNYDRVHKLSQRLGYKTSEALWAANPVVPGLGESGTDDMGLPVGPEGQRRFATSKPGEGGGGPGSTSGILLGRRGYAQWAKDMRERGESVPAWSAGQPYRTGAASESSATTETVSPKEVVDQLLQEEGDDDDTYVTFTRAANNFSEFSSAKKEIANMGLSEAEAHEECTAYNNSRTPEQIEAGVKMEYTKADNVDENDPRWVFPENP